MKEQDKRFKATEQECAEQNKSTLTRSEALRLMGLTTGALAAGPALAACGGGGQQSGQVNLQFWNTFSTAEIELLHKMGRDYEKQNPNVKIDFFEIPFDQRETKIPQAVETNSLPDIIRADYPYQYYLATRNKLLVLDDYVKDWDRFDTIYDVAWTQVTHDDRIVGIPQDKFTDVFNYNQDKFNKDGVKRFPNTWNELVSACKKMTHDGEYGIGWYGTELFTPLLLQAGGSFFNEDVTKVTFNEEPGVTALQFLDDLANKYKVAPKGIAGWEYADADNALKAGIIGMAPFGSWIIANYRDANVPWTLGIGKMPEGPAGRGAQTSAAFYMVTNTSENQEEAVKLIKWLVNRENALQWAKTLDHEPIDEYVAKQPHFDKPIFSAFQESLDFVSAPPPTAGFNVVESELTQAIQKTLLGDAEPKQALNEAASSVTDALGLS